MKEEGKEKSLTKRSCFVGSKHVTTSVVSASLNILSSFVTYPYLLPMTCNHTHDLVVARLYYDNRDDNQWQPQSNISC